MSPFLPVILAILSGHSLLSGQLSHQYQKILMDRQDQFRLSPHADQQSLLGLPLLVLRSFLWILAFLIRLLNLENLVSLSLLEFLKCLFHLFLPFGLFVHFDL